MRSSYSSDALTNVKLNWDSDWSKKPELIVDSFTSCRTDSSAKRVKKLCKDGRLDEALLLVQVMEKQGAQPSLEDFVYLLQACTQRKKLALAKRVHNLIVENGLGSNSYLGDSIVTMYVKCGSLCDAVEIFKGLRHSTVYSWTALISGYTKEGQPQKALELFQQMLREGVQPNKYTFVCMLKTCSILTDVDMGKRLHNDVIRNKCEADLYVGTALVDMYAKCGNMVKAQQVFDSLPERDVVTWNAIISGYVQQQKCEEALHLLGQMQDYGVLPDKWTLVSGLKACGMLAASEEETWMSGMLVKMQSFRRAKLIHAEAIKRSYESNVFIGSTLVDVYAKCGNMLEANEAFQSLQERDVVIWTAMISGYARQEQGEMALELYVQMQQSGIEPDNATFLCILKACSSIGALGICNMVHHDLCRRGAKLSVEVATALVRAYGKCGNMVAAQQIFDTLPHHDLVSWNTLLSAYAQQGDCKATLSRFEQMQLEGIFPDAVSFVSVLTACSHAGVVDEGLQYFELMHRKYGITATLQHYTSLVDLLGRAGLLHRLEELLTDVAMALDLGMWLCLLGASRKYSCIQIGRRAFDRAICLDPTGLAAYVIMSSIYADAGMLDEVAEIEKLGIDAGAWKKPGHSWIVYKNEVHKFVVGNKYNQCSRDVEATLQFLCVQLKELDVLR